MLTARDIICISTIDWDFIWQGHQEIMSTLARAGNRVLFIENLGVRRPSLRDLPRIRRRFANWLRGVTGFREEGENLYIFSPLALPFPYSRVARVINRWLLALFLRRWMRVMRFHDPILWTFLPTLAALDLIAKLEPKLTIYYCIDNFAVSSPQARRIEASEQELFRRADLVFVTSRNLYEKARQHNSRVHLFPFGVSLRKFEEALRQPAARLPKELEGLPHPLIGYVGGVHKWLDQGLLRAIAERGKGSLVFVGPIQTDVSALQGLPRIHFLGEQDHGTLPDYIRGFDVGLIPYALTEYTDNVFPTKLTEYLAMGTPVVSTPLPEVLDFNREHGDVVLIGRDPEEFLRRIDEAVASEGGTLERRHAAASHSWERKIARMCALIEAELARKEGTRLAQWREALKGFLRTTRRCLVQLALPVLLLYLAIFHTPLLWYAAGPLRVSDPPARADAIVIFAGGVGESGKAGQGYEERVGHAVDLYKRGLASRMIFSSGYVYFFQEADVMSALAISLGVPPSAIILEKRAGNTYENVRFSAELLRRNGWRSILLVSSPYHMRRASLVFRKETPWVQVIHVPVPLSRFYGSPGDPITWGKVKGILHEFAGIAYYWLNGYL